MIKIILDGEEVTYRLRNCYRRTRSIKTRNGVHLKIVVWNGYASWSKTYSLIIRSIGGKYSTSKQIKSLDSNLTIDLTKD